MIVSPAVHDRQALAWPSDRLHLADVTMFWSPSGGGVRRYLLAKRAWLRRRSRWRHSLVLPLTASAPRDRLVSVPSLPLPFSRGYRVARSRRLSAAVLRDLKPDVIEAGDPYNLAWAAIDAGQALQVPVVGFMHSDLGALARRLGGAVAEALALRYLRGLYAHVDCVLAPSRALAERMSAELRTEVQWQPLGVDTAVFNPSAADAAWRLALGIAPSTRIALYAGRFSPEKNLSVVVDAVSRLSPDWTLVLMGDGPAFPSDAVARCKARVLRLPFEPDVRRLATALASADAFVHAGDAETFGLGALEAMACGTPVVGCLGGAMTELVDRRVGRVADMPEARRMAEAMDALADEGLRRRLGDAARLRSLHYDWDAVLERISERYAGLAQRTGRLNALVSLAGQAGHARPSAAGSRQADGRATAASRPHVAA